MNQRFSAAIALDSLAHEMWRSVLSHMVAIRVVNADALQHQCDVLVLKYAQAWYGLDEAVMRLLVKDGVSAVQFSPGPQDTALIDTANRLAARIALFVGTEPLGHFDYKDIRSFGRRALERSADDSSFRHIALTMHGGGFGLDEREAFVSLVAGLLDAVRSGVASPNLELLTVVERDQRRCTRLASLLDELVPGGQVGSSAPEAPESEAEERLRSAGYESASKPHVFVAMPFGEAFSDLYHYGISGAVNSVGLLCERADLIAFTGDILEKVKRRISAADLVVADLTGANANVYLEVGYAWGRGIPTVLVVDSGDELKFDVRGQRCLRYENIRDLEATLSNELALLGYGSTNKKDAW